MSKRQHNFSPRSYIWAQVSGTHLANSHQGAPTLYLFQFQTHFYILTFINYLYPNYRHFSTFNINQLILPQIGHISTFLHFPIISVSILGKFLPFYTSLNSTFQDFFIIQLFLPRSRYMSTFLQLFLSQFHTEVYISHWDFLSKFFCPNYLLLLVFLQQEVKCAVTNPRLTESFLITFNMFRRQGNESLTQQ